MSYNGDVLILLSVLRPKNDKNVESLSQRKAHSNWNLFSVCWWSGAQVRTYTHTLSVCLGVFCSGVESSPQNSSFFFVIYTSKGKTCVNIKHSHTGTQNILNDTHDIVRYFVCFEKENRLNVLTVHKHARTIHTHNSLSCSFVFPRSAHCSLRAISII